MFVPNTKWSAQAVGKMHRYRIKNTELAERCGYTPAYLSTVINGNKDFESEQAANKTRDAILSALDEIAAERRLQMDELMLETDEVDDDDGIAQD